jgi:adenosylcobyric acid synthase
MGRTELFGGKPIFKVQELNGKKHDAVDGCVSEDARVIGAYMHGLFDSPAILSRWLSHVGVQNVEVPEAQGIVARDDQYDLLAEYFEKHIDIDGLMGLFMRDRF